MPLHAFLSPLSLPLVLTVKMLVVNSELLVYGVSNLRLCDASIIPVLPSANPQATVYGLPEHGAQIIKTAYLTADHVADDE